MNGTGHPQVAGGRSRVDEDLEREVEAIVQAAGCELVHMEFAGGALRIFIDREGTDPERGVDLSDCELVSKQVSALLDVLDFGGDRYVLEVSSPGLDRQLYRARDYERFVGRKVRVQFFGEGGKQTVTGRLEAFDPEGGGRATVVDDSDTTFDIPLADISVARLEVEL